jgi:hypothetical protein
MVYITEIIKQKNELVAQIEASNMPKIVLKLLTTPLSVKGSTEDAGTVSLY